MRSLERFFGNLFLGLLKLSVVRQNVSPDKIDHESIKNILVVLRHQMGDMLLSTPMLRSLKLEYPGSTLTLVTKSSSKFYELFKEDKTLADDVIEFENGFENFINLIKVLRDKNIDLAVIPSTVAFSVTNHLIAYYSKAKLRAGVSSINTLDNKAEFVLNVKNDFLWESKKIHFIERNLDVIRQLGIQPKEKRIRVNLSEENINFASKFFADNFPDSSRPVIGFHPGAAKPGNIWAAEKFADLAFRFIRNYNAYIYISEGPDDSEAVNKLAGMLEKKEITGTFKRQSDVLKNAPAVIGRLSLTNCAAVLARLDIFVANDTGIMHLASGLNTPVLALFGPTKAYSWGPIGENKASIQSASSNINSISADKVYEACCKFLELKNSMKN